MICYSNANFIQARTDEFTNKNGKLIQFTKVTLVDENGETLALSAASDLGFEKLERFQPVRVALNVWVDSRTGYLRGRIVGVE